MLILEGSADRGKSQLVKIFEAIAGNENSTGLRTKHLDERFETHRFIDKTLLTGADVKANFIQESGASLIKALVGGDSIPTERKRGNETIEVDGDFCVVLSTNSRLRVRLEGDVDAWQRRLLLVHFESPPIKKKIPNYWRYLIEKEGSGILNFAIDGLWKLMQDINTTGEMSMTKDQRHRVEGLLAESESARHFVEQKLLRTESSNDALTTEEITKAYGEFCSRMGWNPLPSTLFAKALPELILELRGVPVVNGIKRPDGRKRGYRELRLANDKEDKQYDDF